MVPQLYSPFQRYLNVPKYDPIGATAMRIAKVTSLYRTALPSASVGWPLLHSPALHRAAMSSRWGTLSLPVIS